ncbi:Interferon-induced GTP-binding protein Mx1 [Hondaea fermentalgiana]|uniref:Interferon-induced GTP-binding protein Mx1 n=1 Tax=Hondaea fermentalgiana TaxID=2315210 RepID=A0A2R5G766_9STRA|nr:Interferon-induced GTP-binding protein Mx1 [Hondaea fermentalgiana]|eukprot:GBG25638.1 Interferon-induced GTP-binding protein Mx1 [Hondaea fermentalgiana]
MADAASESSWTRVDRTAFEVLAIDGSASVTDEDVRAAYDEQASKATDDHQRQRLREAFQTIETEAFRAGYCLALSVFDDQSNDGFFDNAQVEPRADPVHSKGIAGILCAPDAPYARLLQAAMQVQGRFELELPQIVVCGTESQGKSSTLERIAMRDIFPRDRRFCTRLPVRLMLRTSRHQNQVTIRVKDLNTNEITRETEPQICVTGDQTDEPFSSQVSELIREFISDEHPDDKGRKVVIDREVQIEIRAPSVPTIDLVDLPGIVAAPDHARQATTHITQRMLAQEHVLVLAVVSAQSEALNSNGIWPLLHEANKPSIVVLTRVDLEGGEEDLRARLERDPAVMPDDVRIDFVVPVANRDTRKHIDMDSLRDSYTREETALRAACKMEGMEYDVTKHGMPGVLHALNEMIRAYMRDEWVDAELQRCKVAFREIFDDLLDLGTTPGAIKPEAIVSEIRKGLDAFMDMPTSELLKDMQLPVCFKFILDFPRSAPLVRRAYLLKNHEAEVKNHIAALTYSAWESFKALVMRDVIDGSRIPLKIGRFSSIREHIGTTLEDSFRAASDSIIEEAFLRVISQLKDALTTRSDELDTDVIWADIYESVIMNIICRFSTETLTERLFATIDLELREEYGVAVGRVKIEEQIDAIYRTVQVLQELRGLDDIPDDFQGAKGLIKGGVTDELLVLLETGIIHTSFFFGTIETVLQEAGIEFTAPLFGDDGSW